MLTKEHAIAEYKKGRIYPDRLSRGKHGHYLQYAERMLEVYRKGTGKTRETLHRSILNILQDEPDCPTQRIGAFCKLLDDVSVYDRDKGGKAARLRKKIFRLAAPYHPLVVSVDRLFDNSEKTVKNEIAEKMGESWEEIEKQLFADVFEYHKLRVFKDYPGAAELLSRYNVAQVQAALYRAVDMIVWASRDLKHILRHAKLARLMHSIDHEGGGHYRIYFNGPASLMRETRRYGVAMAKFLPALLDSDDWRLHARIKIGRRGYTLYLPLSSKDGLKGHYSEPEEFDSTVEENFARKWGDEARDGWTLEHESELIHHGQKVFFPDFVLRHEDGRKVYLEIVGFWTPEYLKAKMETLSVFSGYDILIAIAERVARDVPDLPPNVIRYKTALKIKDVLEKL